MALYLGSNQVQLFGGKNRDLSIIGFMPDGQLIAQKEYSFPLSSTNYSSLTIGTTAQNLILPATEYTASPTAGGLVTCLRVGDDYDGTDINFFENDYVVIGRFDVDYVFTANETTMNSLAHGIKTRSCKDFQMYKSNPIDSTTGGTNSSSWNVSSTNTTYATATLYRNSSGTYGRTSSVGIYTTNMSAALGNSSSTTNPHYISLTIGAVSAKASSSYFTIDAMNYIDPTNTILKLTWDIYEGDLSIASRIHQYANHECLLTPGEIGD